MNAAVIGTGFLGREIVEQLSKIDSVSIITHNNNPKYSESKKFDFFTDDLKNIFQDKKIDTVFFPAKIEFSTEEELLRKSMERFIEACKGKRLVYFSSDGIFDGRKGMYKEDDLPMPVTLYGKNLQLCENLIQELSDDYLIIRPSYITGKSSNGSLDPRFVKAIGEIKNKKSVERFSDMYKSPMDVKQVAEVAIKLAILNYNGIVHVAGEKMSVFEFFKKGFEALEIPIENLVPIRMPEVKPIDFLSDTSLNNSLMQTLSGIKPVDLKEAFK